uniref:MULE transposase domain-containing protein n=1 Tax=Lactuca sativa TaxID=4236 RepID=A0A9R1XFY0_LACSA|nr:hypothetical protein LSAT_V11C400215600 [Lactuca sativa]
MPDGKNYYSKFYVCFDALKKGWKEGCRKIIGLDGCFLKGICKGELLCDVGRDANNGIYHIAWVVVCVKNKENWRWVLDLRIDDLGLYLGYGYSVISDQHKGLIEVVKELLPYVEHMQCGKHISQNLRKRYSAAQYESIFWKASKETTKVDFKVSMKELEVLDPSAHQYLMDKDPKTWSRAYFQPGRCCDVVENGMSESLNVVIEEANYHHARGVEDVYDGECVQEEMQGSRMGQQICPTIRELVNEIKKSLRHYLVLPSGLNQFEMFIWWILKKEIAYAGFGSLNEWFVSIMLQLLMKTYKFRLAPMNGSNLWPATNYTPPLPPVRRTMPGRPATKRKRIATENLSSKRKKTTQTQNKGKEQVKVSKAGKKQKCNLCKIEGHKKELLEEKTKVANKYLNGGAQAVNEGDEGNAMNEGNQGNEMNEGNQGNAMNEGDEVNEGDQVVNDDGGAVNDSGEAVNEVHVELTPLEFDASGNGEPSQVHVKEQETRETPITTLLKKTRRKKSKRIIKLKLGKKVGGVDAHRNSEAKPVTLE